MFTDETKIKLFKDKDGTSEYVKCHKQSRLKQENLKKTMKYGVL